MPRTDQPVATPLSRTETPTYRLGYYFQDLVSLTSKLKVLAGLRWSFQKAAIAKTFDAVTNDRIAKAASSKTDKAFSPRFGLVYQPDGRTSLFVSYSNNFTVNTGSDIYGSNLKPSLIDQYETGVKRDFLNGRLSVNITVYRIINNDLAIQAQFDQNGNVNTVSTVKEFSGETTSDGIETDVTGTIMKDLNFLAGYSYNFMRYTKTPGGTGSYIVGERLVNNPAHTANASVFYTVPASKLKGLKLGASAFYTGERNGGWNNTIGQAQKYNRLIPVSGFATADVSAGYTFGKLSVLGKVSNIGNTLNYYVHENYSVNPIPPRQLIVTLSFFVLVFAAGCSKEDNSPAPVKNVFIRVKNTSVADYLNVKIFPDGEKVASDFGPLKAGQVTGYVGLEKAYERFGYDIKFNENLSQALIAGEPNLKTIAPGNYTFEIFVTVRGKFEVVTKLVRD